MGFGLSVLYTALWTFKLFSKQKKTIESSRANDVREFFETIYLTIYCNYITSRLHLLPRCILIFAYHRMWFA